MKAWLCKQIFIGALLTLLLIPTTAIGEDVTTISPIKTDEHWIYIVQQDDLKTFEVKEYFYINNTGEAIFNDSLYMWIQNNSIIVADCCNDTPNMACRYNVRGYMECFYLNKTDENNLYVGYPFLSENRLSYYGQRESLSITVFSTTNASLDNDTLHLNATIGGPSIPREQKGFQDIGIHLTSENLDVGMLPVIDPYMPFYIMTIENITLLNNGTDTEVISFSVSDLPQGWAAEIWNNTRKLDNVSLFPQEYANLTLIITAPSNIASIYVRYTTQIGMDGNETRGSFTKRYLYETKKITYEVYLLTIDELEISNDLKMVHDELFWIEDYGRYWFLAKNEDVLQNSYTTISMKLEKTAGDQSNPYIIWVPIFIVILIVGILLLKKIDFFKEMDTLQKRDASPEKRRKKLLEEKRIIQELIERTETDQSSGLIDEKSAKKMKTDYRAQIGDIDKKLAEYPNGAKMKHTEIKKSVSKKKEKRIKELEEQKKEVLSAIKRVEHEFEAETMSKEDYERFRTAYKKRAVEILKEIDRLDE
ncbi:hypothetical protein MBGDF03_00497 [Thermoplasmatales archaeon SCGC AB-540-F20]|nr:hypothetical protein MBGDF03_00497 [Thermoplasmatales archaeon SCGC AB-540-F20]